MIEVVEVGPVRIAWGFGADARERVLRRLLTDAGSPHDEIVHRCPTCGSPDHGPLRTSTGAAVVSVAHSLDLTVGALATADVAASVGIDVEVDKGSAPLTDLAALFAPNDPPTIREWTAIEAVVKADGRGLRIAPGEVRITDRVGILLPGGVRAELPGRSSIEVAPVVTLAGYAVSVAIDPARGWVR